MSRSARVGPVMLAALGVACTTPVDVVFEAREDLSTCRTWDWLAYDRSHVVAPHTPAHEVTALHERVRELVGRELQASGLERSRRSPDIYVTYRLALVRELVTVHEPLPERTLWSHTNASPSYTIQATRRTVHSYERSKLVIGVADRGGQRVIWLATRKDRSRGDFAPHLERAVASVLGRFPRASGFSAPERTPPSPPRREGPERRILLAMTEALGSPPFGGN